MDSLESLQWEELDMAEVELITPDSGTETTADNQDTDITPEPSPIPENWKEWIPEDIRNTPVIQETKDIK